MEWYVVGYFFKESLKLELEMSICICAHAAGVSVAACATCLDERMVNMAGGPKLAHIITLEYVHRQCSWCVQHLEILSYVLCWPVVHTYPWSSVYRHANTNLYDRHHNTYITCMLKVSELVHARWDVIHHDSLSVVSHSARMSFKYIRDVCIKLISGHDLTS
jgi:hypothetical protein